MRSAKCCEQMTTSDPQTCRRALREISEIAAVAVLQDSKMTDQEALQTIVAIAEWVREEAPAEGAPCDKTVRNVHDLTASKDFDAMSDHDATRLFSEVLKALHRSNGTAFAGAA